MPYTAEISRANPTCFLFLIDQSGSMAETFGGGAGRRKADGVADAINRLLQTLVIRCATGDDVYPRYEVGVIGYGRSVGPAFGGVLAGRSLVPINEVANAPASIQERTRKTDDGAGGLIDQTVKFPVWFEPVADGGTPMCEALRRAHHLLQEWVSRHQTAYPPMVFNITDGDATDGDPTSHAQAIGSLSTADGNVLVFNCHISSQLPLPSYFLTVMPACRTSMHAPSSACRACSLVVCVRRAVRASSRANKRVASPSTPTW